MNISEPLGYLASLLVLATFCMSDMKALRLLAIGSNLAFIGYGALTGIGPVLLLHLVLLPVNLLRLAQSGLPAGHRDSRPPRRRLAAAARTDAVFARARRQRPRRLP